MMDEEREEMCLDRPIDGATPKPRSKQELYDALVSIGVRDLTKYNHQIATTPAYHAYIWHNLLSLNEISNIPTHPFVHF
jgi:hypothetical protein